MRKIHVITQKEAVNEEKLRECTVIVIDVFLATSTIAFLLDNGYETIFPVLDTVSAIDADSKNSEPCLLLGEKKGLSIPRFQYPDPVLIKPDHTIKNAIICSTNGTVAIHKALKAKRVFTSSLVNGHELSKQLHKQSDNSSIVLICAGNDDRFSLEDFIGAGQVIDNLLQKGDYVLSDAAILACQSYKNSKKASFNNLYTCETAKMLNSFGYTESVDLVIKNHEKINVVPFLLGDKLINWREK